MSEILNSYQITDEDGLHDVEELDNSMIIRTLIEPSETYLQRLEDLPAPIRIPSETEILGQQLVEKDLQILELQQENQILGQQMVDIDLRLLMGGM